MSCCCSVWIYFLHFLVTFFTILFHSGSKVTFLNFGSKDFPQALTQSSVPLFLLHLPLDRYFIILVIFLPKSINSVIKLQETVLSRVCRESRKGIKLTITLNTAEKDSSTYLDFFSLLCLKSICSVSKSSVWPSLSTYWCRHTAEVILQR